jgi:hypothetical protein
MQSSTSIGGTLSIRRIGVPKAPLSWRVQNTLRWTFLWGWFTVQLAKAFSKLTGITTISSELRLRKNVGGTVIRNADGTVHYVRGGEWIDYGVVSRRLVTNNGVAFLVDAWQNIVELENMKYHGCGTSSTAESASDSALGAESTTILNPDSTRATGTQSEASANQLVSAGTLTFDGSGAIVEHGLLSQAATGGGVLWDRSVFSAVNVSSGDSILFTYTATFTSGG